MNLSALLLAFVPTFEDYHSISLYCRIFDDNLIALIRKRIKRKYRKLKKIFIFTRTHRPRRQKCCRGPPLLSKNRQKPPRNNSVNRPSSLADEGGHFFMKNPRDLQMVKKYATITTSC